MGILEEIKKKDEKTRLLFAKQAAFAFTMLIVGGWIGFNVLVQKAYFAEKLTGTQKAETSSSFDYKKQIQNVLNMVKSSPENKPVSKEVFDANLPPEELIDEAVRNYFKINQTKDGKIIIESEKKKIEAEPTTTLDNNQ